MKILFSPSETKNDGGNLEYINKNSFIFPELFEKRLEILEKYKANNITIPMKPQGRSLNLSTSAAIVLYEALRQLDFELED